MTKQRQLELLREIRDGLAPSLAGLSEDDPEAALRWVIDELLGYLVRVGAALGEEAGNDSDS